MVLVGVVRTTSKSAFFLLWLGHTTRMWVFQLLIKSPLSVRYFEIFPNMVVTFLDRLTGSGSVNVAIVSSAELML